MINRLTSLICLLLLFSCSNQSNQTLIVAASANTQFAITEILKHFESETGIKTNLVIGSSGKLTAQIEQGAPFDVFLSADLKYPEYLYGKGLSSVPVVYAIGQLVMIAKQKNDEGLSPVFLLDSTIRRIAIPNPELAPYGKATLQYLHKLGVLNNLQDRLVYGENVAQTVQFVESGSAEVGFTAASQILPKLSDLSLVYDVIPESYHDPIVQGMVLIKEKDQIDQASKELFKYLQSSAARAIWSSYGFTIPQE